MKHIPIFIMEYLPVIDGLDYMVQVIIPPNEKLGHDKIYFFDLSSEGFGHMFGEIDEYPDIEYVDKINEDDNDELQNGRLRIIGVDIL